jgi:hypothetical protein
MRSAPETETWGELELWTAAGLSGERHQQHRALEMAKQ